MLAFIINAATLAYLGLAVMGWGGLNAFFSHPALIGLLSAYVPAKSASPAPRERHALGLDPTVGSRSKPGEWPRPAAA